MQLIILLKPVSFERFRSAVNRVMERISVKNKEGFGHIMIRANKKDYRINFDDILYLEAQGDYVKICNKREIVCCTWNHERFSCTTSGKQV